MIPAHPPLTDDAFNIHWRCSYTINFKFAIGILGVDMPMSRHPKLLDVVSWIAWEGALKRITADVRLSPRLLPGHTNAATGRMTYSEIRTKQDFGQFDYILRALVQPDSVHSRPSLAAVMPGAMQEYLILHPNENNDDDIEAIADLFDNVEIGEPAYGICILASDIGAAHGTAFIAWKSSSSGSSGRKIRRHFAFYDPLSYRRKRTRANGDVYYDDFIHFREVLEWVKEEGGVKFDLHDLSAHCIRRSEEEFDCPQYHMNAEYCYFYALHFLYAWAGIGKPLDNAGFSAAVKASYIVAPSELSRKYTNDTLLFRVVLISFVVSVFSRYFKMLTQKQKKDLNIYAKGRDHINTFTHDWEVRYGFGLISK